MSRPREGRRLSYEARARIADNVFVLRRGAGYSQEALGERAMVAVYRIGKIEHGDVVGPVNTYVRLAGSLSITLGELLAGVRWTPGGVELQRDPGYEVEFEVEPPKRV